MHAELRPPEDRETSLPEFAFELRKRTVSLGMRATCRKAGRFLKDVHHWSTQND